MFRNDSRLKVLIVRTDRLGDVLLSTPVIEGIRRAIPKAEITFLAQGFVKPLLEGIPGVSEVMVYDPKGAHHGVRGFFHLMEELAQKKFQISICVQSNPRVAAALYGVGVPIRVGPRSKLHSYLFFNKGIRQRRSFVEMHEADYGLDLLRVLGIRHPTLAIPTTVSVPEEATEWAKNWLTVQGLLTQEENPKKLIVVHPGMGGSALNWPESHYIDLIDSLLGEGHRVLITGGAQEDELIHRVVSNLKTKEHKGALAIYGGREAKSVEYLAALYQHCSIVVAPSTGPLHLAVALGKPTVSFFPPIRVQSALRWGPYSIDPENASILHPEVYCGEDFKCRGSVCNYFPCMKSILPRQALSEVSRQLGKSTQ